MVTKVRGQFDEFEGTAHVDTQNPAASTVNVTIQTASVTTGQAQRDGHLKSPDFFDVETYPQITFISTDVEREGTEWSITGDLTINAVTKPVTVLFEETGEAKDPFGNLRVGFEGSVTLNRTDWGLKWNSPLETGGVLVSEKVTLEFDVSAIRQPV
jgi:polyisoprenoid-binding protein YceI